MDLCAIDRATAYVISNKTTTQPVVLPFDGEQSDASGLHVANDTKITIAVAGTYKFGLFLPDYSAPWGNAETRADVLKNGTSIASFKIPSAAGVGPLSYHVTDVAAVGDYYEVRINDMGLSSHTFSVPAGVQFNAQQLA